jgi:hypothetical protein
MATSHSSSDLAFSLSVEENGFALGATGRLDVAAGYLSSIPGKLEAQEMSGRLAAASHSLLARGLYRLNFETGEGELDPGLARCVELLAESGRSLRWTQTSRQAPQERAIALIIAKDEQRAIEHDAELGVAAQLIALDTRQVMSERLSGLIDAPASEGPAEPIGTITGETLHLARSYANEGALRRDDLLHLLRAALPAEHRERLADDLIGANRFGSVMEIAAGAQDGQAISKRGLLFFMTDTSGWIFSYNSTDQDSATIWHANHSVARMHSESLCVLALPA